MYLETDVIVAFAGVIALAALGGVVHWYSLKKEVEARGKAKNDS
jgi:hypothetical protein